MNESTPLNLSVQDRRGTEYPVILDSYGTFTATIEGQDLVSSTYSGLRQAAEKIPRRHTCIPFTAPSGTRGVATGMHVEGTRVLVRWHDGTAEQIGTYNLSRFMRQLSDEEVAELNRLHEEKTEVSRRIEDFITERYFDVAQAVRDELKKGEKA